MRWLSTGDSGPGKPEPGRSLGVVADIDVAQYPGGWDPVLDQMGRTWCLLERPDLRAGAGCGSHSAKVLVRAKPVTIVRMLRVGSEREKNGGRGTHMTENGTERDEEMLAPKE